MCSEVQARGRGRGHGRRREAARQAKIARWLVIIIGRRYTLWSKNLTLFYFLNNSVKNEPIFTTDAILTRDVNGCMSVHLLQEGVLSQRTSM